MQCVHLTATVVRIFSRGYPCGPYNPVGTGTLGICPVRLREQDTSRQECVLVGHLAIGLQQVVKNNLLRAVHAERRRPWGDHEKTRYARCSWRRGMNGSAWRTARCRDTSPGRAMTIEWGATQTEAGQKAGMRREAGASVLSRLAGGPGACSRARLSVSADAHEWHRHDLWCTDGGKK